MSGSVNVEDSAAAVMAVVIVTGGACFISSEPTGVAGTVAGTVAATGAAGAPVLADIGVPTTRSRETNLIVPKKTRLEKERFRLLCV